MFLDIRKFYFILFHFPWFFMNTNAIFCTVKDSTVFVLMYLKVSNMINIHDYDACYCFCMSLYQMFQCNSLSEMSKVTKVSKVILTLTSSLSLGKRQVGSVNMFLTKFNKCHTLGPNYLFRHRKSWMTGSLSQLISCFHLFHLFLALL